MNHYPQGVNAPHPVGYGVGLPPTFEERAELARWRPVPLWRWIRRLRGQTMRRWAFNDNLFHMGAGEWEYATYDQCARKWLEQTFDRNPAEVLADMTGNKTATEIRAKMNAVWGGKLVDAMHQANNSIVKTMVDSINGHARLPDRAWEPTPKWMFWKPTRRRLIAYRSNMGGDDLYEYQHPAYVAREALEKRFAPQTN